MKDLKERTVRGAMARGVAQAATFVIRFATLYVLARLLEPNDFGLVGMVTSVIGILHLFKEFGLSTATIQRPHVTREQLSTLFWINVVVGALLGLICVAVAPAVARFYNQPKLFWITIVLAAGFLFNSAGVQHSALLQRQMRFATLAMIDVLSLLLSSVLGVAMVLANFGYWGLVGMTVAAPFVSTIGLWVSTGWLPGRARRQAGVRSMMRFGGIATFNGLIVYIAYNLDKVLVGRLWGADAIGLYGRAYQTINLPSDNLNSAIGGLAFSALARVQDDPRRLADYFVKGYSLVLAATIPTTIFAAVFAPELIAVLLGRQWADVVPLFRRLAPTVLALSIINPLGWLLVSLGRINRSLAMACVIAPLVILGYAVGLPYGPGGVAAGFSTALSVWVIPHILWSIRDTSLSFKTLAMTIGKPIAGGSVGAVIAMAVHSAHPQALATPVALLIDATVFFVTYAVTAWFVLGQKELWRSVLSEVRFKSNTDARPAVV